MKSSILQNFVSRLIERPTVEKTKNTQYTKSLLGVIQIDMKRSVEQDEKKIVLRSVY